MEGRAYRGVPYTKDKKGPQLTVYLPEETEGAFPVVVYLGADGDDCGAETVLPMLNGGYAVAAVEYAPVGKSRFPLAIRQVKAAVRFLRRHSAAMQLDPAHMILWGQGAGGYIAAMTAVSGGQTELCDLSLGYANEPEDVQAAVLFFAPFGPTAASGPPWDGFFAGMDPLGQYEGLTSPLKLVTPDTPPMCLFAKEEAATQAMTEALQSVHGKVQTHILGDSELTEHSVFATVFSFLAEYLR